MHNIEKSAFRKGEHVGYCGGTWRIRRNAKGWIATVQTGTGRKPIKAATLAGISEALTALDAKAAQERRDAAMPNPFAGAPVLPE